MSMTPCCVECKRPSPAVTLNMRSVLGNFYLICEACEARQQGKSVRYSDSSVARQPGTVPDIRAQSEAVTVEPHVQVINPKGDPALTAKLQAMACGHNDSQHPIHTKPVITDEMTCTEKTSAIAQHMERRMADGRSALFIQEDGVASALEDLVTRACEALRFRANHAALPRPGAEFDTVEMSRLAQRLTNANRSAIYPMMLALLELKGRGLTENSGLAIPALFTWGDGWLTGGFNYCISSAIDALTYLKNHDVPSYGQTRFNCEHLFDIAADLARTWADVLAPVIAQVGFAGSIADLLARGHDDVAAMVAKGTLDVGALAVRRHGGDTPIGRNS